ncbi:hypothetical protein QBC32DRAFT_248799 [Pseudoneurospora amorphoporcata]|uniref:LysM domain-containing protein n=1 Tax=Pseudoneurospora amorphoporcata TaxID=241081 RepID=A0AAN6SA96_9PEZI|nr:hypothetical protein QBC32DRAFT_248799 [Pseudoneurospora amorphoporcata]
MRIPHREVLSLLAVLALGVHGQQLNGTIRGLDYPGLSSGCLTALNTTVAACPAFLASVSVDNPRLNTDQLSALCTTACRTGLTSVRSTIAAACKAAADTIELPDGVVYPATLVVDRFLYTYDLSCRKDTSSGRYCDELFFSWLASGNATTAGANCSDCSLGVVQIQLNSPFGYDDDFALGFKSATASCSSAGYTFTTPATYAVKTNLPNATEDVSTPSCSKPYVAVAGDSCDAIALAKGVSTYSIVRAGGLLPDCSNLQAGASLCLPSPCTLYRVQEGDTCASIAASRTGLTGISLLAWNPNISPICSNIADLVGTLICVTPPGGTTSDVTITAAPPATTTPATAVPRPTNAHPNSTARCASWYYVQDGDYCQSISIRQNIALPDFYFLNPGIDANCTNLWLDTSYCVKAVGDINTYSGYPYSTSAIYSLTSSAYVTTTTNVTTTAPSVTPIVALPLAPGTKAGCDAYVEYKAPDPYRDQSESEDVRLVTEHMNSCDFASSAYPVSLDDFLSWNPSLASISPCYLQPGYSYCAFDKTSYIVPIPASLCVNITTAYPGTVSTCSCFTTVMGYDANYTTCADVAADANIKTSDLTAWNPWMGSNCDKGLFAGLTGTQERAVCIGVRG